MDRNELLDFETALIGRQCTISRREDDWILDLSDDGGYLAISVPWRVVSKGRIAFGSADHGHLFGLPAPFDGDEICRGLVGGQIVTSARVDRQTADHILNFGPEIRIEVFNNSIGIAMGGGNVTIFACCSA